jgi:hypothetical protein
MPGVMQTEEEGLMTSRDYFIVGCKLFGVWCFVLFLTDIFRVIRTLFVQQNLSPDIAGFWRLTKLFGILKVASFFGLGVYLIRYGDFVHNIAYPNDTYSDHMTLRETFTLALKLLGMYLIIIYIPYFLDVLSRYIVYINSPKYIDMTDTRDFLLMTVSPTVGAIILGIYLVKSGDFFSKIGLRSTHKKDQ